MNQFLKQIICVCLIVLAGQAIADSLSDAQSAYVASDYAKAAELFRPLAEQGNASAQSGLGLMYGLGQGVQKDYVEAEKWLRLAVEQRHVSRQHKRAHSPRDIRAND